MNTTPDETRLALWLDDELTGTELAEMEAWAATQPEQLVAREEIRAYRATISTVLPASEEPPYADFFNSRIARDIREMAEPAAKAAPAPAISTPFWRNWLMPIAACAGMVFAFVIGKQTTGPSSPGASFADLSPVLYTPETGVDATWFASSDAGATVIVLEGVNAIPDTIDFTRTVYLPTEREGSRTAVIPSLQTTFGQ